MKKYSAYMYIDKIIFTEDYKCIKKDTEIDLSGTGNYCTIVGLNGSGKTTIIEYLLRSFTTDREQNKKSIFKIIKQGNNYPKSDDDLPKYMIFNYSGESKYGTNSYGNNTITSFKLDSSIWHLACYILQLLDDPIIDEYNLKSDDVEIRKKNCPYKHGDNFWDYMFNIDPIIKLYPINFDRYNQTDRINIFKCIFSYTKVYGKESNGFNNMHNQPTGRIKELYNNTIIQLSEGQKKLLVLKLIMYLANEDTLVLLDEPDANLDIQKKRELLEMIQSCKGQVILTTHDPIMTKWMKNHLIFIKDGQQISSDICYAINEMSGGEVSFQENMLMFQKKYLVIVEGKSDLACIEKAIRSNGLSSKFEPIFFLAQNSASSTKATFDNLLGKLVDNNNSIKQILFLFDADDAGYKGKVQIEDIKEEHKSEDISQKIDYLFYRPCYNSAEDNDFDNKIKDYFYLEGYFPTECYPSNPNKNDIVNLIPHKDLYDILDDKDEDKYLNYNEIQRLNYFTDRLNKKNGLKTYFRNQTNKIDEKYFLGFRPLLEKILKKFEVK
ncbi:MAG: AAA family ATPase, partial [Bacteroidales bacterium]|nr:AAA family ATPase [Bacteroidales bacterium]